MRRFGSVQNSGMGEFAIGLRVADVFEHVAEKISSAVFPDKCLICGELFKKKSSVSKDVLSGPSAMDFPLLLSGMVCGKCSRGFVPVSPPFCSACGIMFTSRRGENRRCGECIKKPKKFRVARAAAAFDGPVADCIHKFKYNGKLQLAHPLSVLLFSAFLVYVKMDLSGTDEVDRIVPVPLHMKRFRERGFNQAFLLVREWGMLAETLGIQKHFKTIDTKILFRKRNTASQTGLARDQRRRNIKNAFYVNPGSKISGERILLIDDVYTTGATVDECAKTLLKAGAGTVDVLTLARTHLS